MALPILVSAFPALTKLVGALKSTVSPAMLTGLAPLSFKGGRFFSYYGRDECRERPIDFRSSNLTRHPCRPNAPPKKPKIKVPFKSMWGELKCCSVPCNPTPRLDTTHYRISDKFTRKYQQTWKECGKLVIRPKFRCCYEKIDLPPIARRKRREHPEIECMRVPPLVTKYGTCPRFQLPACHPANKKGCYGMRQPHPNKGIRFKAPYPSFSECIQPKINPARPSECRCLEMVPMCAAWRYMTERGLKLKKKNR